jgi:hypothetical protein
MVSNKLMSCGKVGFFLGFGLDIMAFASVFREVVEAKCSIYDFPKCVVALCLSILALFI